MVFHGEYGVPKRRAYYPVIWPYATSICSVRYAHDTDILEKWPRSGDPQPLVRDVARGVYPLDWAGDGRDDAYDDRQYGEPV